MALIDSYKTEYELLKNFIEQEEKDRTTEKIAEELAETFTNGNKVLICGNGGSNCDALHFAEEFTGRFRKERRALPAIAISDSSHITCVGNDYGFDYIFSKGVEAYGKRRRYVYRNFNKRKFRKCYKSCRKSKRIRNENSCSFR